MRAGAESLQLPPERTAPHSHGEYRKREGDGLHPF